jgi:hypothetical protein
LVDDRGAIYELALDDAPAPEVSGELRPIASSFEKALPYLVTGLLDVNDTRKDLAAIGMIDQRWPVKRGSGQSGAG